MHKNTYFVRSKQLGEKERHNKDTKTPRRPPFDSAKTPNHPVRLWPSTVNPLFLARVGPRTVSHRPTPPRITSSQLHFAALGEGIHIRLNQTFAIFYLWGFAEHHSATLIHSTQFLIGLVMLLRVAGHPTLWWHGVLVRCLLLLL